MLDGAVVAAMDEVTFVAQRSRIRNLREDVRNRDADLQNTRMELGVTLRQGKQEHELLIAEIVSLKHRRSNIDDQQIRFALPCVQRWDWKLTLCPLPGN